MSCWQSVRLMTTSKRGGPGRGQGRKPLDSGQPTVRVNLTMTTEQRDRLKTLGGSAWIRRMIDSAKLLT